MKKLILILALCHSLSFAHGSGNHKHDKAEKKADRTLHLVNHQFEGTKQWLPGTMVVKAGETIDIHLTNKAPSGVHGFRLWDADHKNALITVNVPKGKSITKRFVAGQKGDILDFDCQIHGAHVGGQIIVL
jgi:FtsP/CotA-like multicopper oxidase with cupredoxin domain